jgi:hypothetical protein
MEKRMQPLQVRTHEGLIWIEPSTVGEDSGAVIDPAQVPALIEWLQETVNELQP